MLEEILDKLVDEKMDCKEYQEIADSVEEQDAKDMFNMLAEDERKHYRILKAYIKKLMGMEED